MNLTIDDLRICPALAGPEDVAMLLARIDALTALADAAMALGKRTLEELDRLLAEQRQT